MAVRRVLEAVCMCSVLCLVTVGGLDSRPSLPDLSYILNNLNAGPQDGYSTQGGQSSGNPGGYVNPKSGVTAPSGTGGGSRFSGLYANNAGDGQRSFGPSPTYGQQSPSYLPIYGQQLPSNTQYLPSYGQQLPSYGQQPPSYGQQPPSYGQQPPSYGQQPPSYEKQPPSYGQQPPSYGQQPPSYGQQPPSYGQQPSSYGAQSGLSGVSDFFQPKRVQPRIDPLLDFEPLGYVYPLDDVYTSPGRVGGGSDLSGYGQGFPRVQYPPSGQYPIEVPSTRPLDHFAPKNSASYPVQVPDLYSKNKVGYDSHGPQNSAPNYAYPQDVYAYRQQLKCWPEFFLEYEHDFSGSVYQEVSGDVHVQNGRAVFVGHGHLALPFFACNDLLPRYSMSFLISPSYSGGTQAIIGNSLIPDKASLLLSLTGHTLTLVVRERRPHLTPEQLLDSCYTDSNHYPGPGGHNAVAGDIVVLSLDIGAGEFLVTIAQEDDWIFLGVGDRHTSKPGRLPTLTNEALYVGAGADPRGGPSPGYYSGTFDAFLFEKCPKGH